MLRQQCHSISPRTMLHPSCAYTKIDRDRNVKRGQKCPILAFDYHCVFLHCRIYLSMSIALPPVPLSAPLDMYLEKGPMV
jgi:hypothetical protein